MEPLCADWGKWPAKPVRRLGAWNERVAGGCERGRVDRNKGTRERGDKGTRKQKPRTKTGTTVTRERRNATTGVRDCRDGEKVIPAGCKDPSPRLRLRYIGAKAIRRQVRGHSDAIFQSPNLQSLVWFCLLPGSRRASFEGPRAEATMDSSDAGRTIDD